MFPHIRLHVRKMFYRNVKNLTDNLACFLALRLKFVLHDYLLNRKFIKLNLKNKTDFSP